MKCAITKSANVLFSIIAFVLLVTCKEDIEHNKVIIAKFPYDKDCAISFTFDDNCRSCTSTIVPLFDQFNYKATFFVITDQVTNWQVWKKLHDNGFEIGNHTSSHLNLSKVYDSAVLDKQINSSYDVISQKIGEAPVSFAHPGHGTNSRVDSVVFEKHLFTRLTPRDFCAWHGWTSKTPEDAIKNKISLAMTNNDWYVPAAHGIKDCWEPISESLLLDVLLFIKENEDRIAVEPFKNIAFYKREKAHTRISVSTNQSNKMIITLKSDLKQDLYNYPLTILVKNYSFPAGFTVTSPNEGLVEVIYKNRDLQLISKPNTTIVIKW